MTCEPDFYLKIYQTKFRGGDKRIYQIFGVPIGNGKMAKKCSSAQKQHLYNITKIHIVVAVLVFWYQPFTVLVTTGLYLT